MTQSAPSLSAELTNLLEEYAARLQAGEAVDAEAFAAAHPDHAEVLRKLLPTMRVLAELGSSPGGETAGRDEHAGTLGDYRILREAGRGGMGVVYEAEQISLRRRVALKVLPFAAAMDPRRLQRFRNEALAAASLHHEHIVPVHGVGCERSIHFYAMQFIDGVTLAQVISRRREPARPGGPEPHPPGSGDPAAPHLPTMALDAATTRPEGEGQAYFRQVAEWGAQAALALEHAHSLGVVHRDVKPGNLMIDGLGKLWVTDFGLAQTGQGDLTMTGDLVGTLRYMSPEQALGRHGLVDHRTDVYSLGATLYELLTGTPAVGGEGREEILRRIASEEPRPPRSLNGAVPRDLETVVLKALAKEPAERYATARELADDLRRFLADEPVRAKRPTLAERASKWARRHRAILRWASLLSVLSIAALAVSLVVALREKGRAEARLKVAREAVDDMWGEFAAEWLAREPGKEEAERRFLTKALRFYEEFAREAGPDPAVRLRVAQALERVGDIHRRMLDYPEAWDAYARGIDCYKTLSEQHPNQPEYRHSLGQCYIKLGFASDPDQLESARQHRKAVAVFQQLVADFPNDQTYRFSLARSLLNLANPLQLSGQMREAEATRRLAVAKYENLLKEGPQLPDYLLGLATTWAGLGVVLANSGRLEEAERVYEQAEQCYARLAPHDMLEYWGKVPHYGWFNRAKCWVWHGELLSVMGRERAGEDAIRRAIKALQKLAADFPRTPHYAESLGSAWRVLGDLYDRGGRIPESDAAYQEAVKVREKGMADFPDNPEGSANLSRLLSRWPREQFRDPRRALELAQVATKLEPRRADYWMDLGVAQFRAGNDEAAIQALERGRSQPGDAAADAPENWLLLAMAHWRRGDRGQARQWYDKANDYLKDHPLERARQRRILAEAGEVLGVMEPGSVTQPKSPPRPDRPE